MKKNYFYLLFSFFLLGKNFAQVPGMPNINGPATVCSEPSTPVTFTATASNAPTSYSWSVQPSAGVIITNSTASVTAISFPNNNPMFYTLYCYATNANGDGIVQYKVVNVFETPTVTFSGAHVFCQGSSTNLSASSTLLSGSSTMSYSWAPPTGLSNTTGYMVNASPAATTIYTLTVTKGPCTFVDTATVFVDLCVGIKSNGSINNDDLTVYPNPSNGDFTIKATQPGDVRIINELGQTIRILNVIPGIETKVDNLPAGIYFVVDPNSRKKLIVTQNR